MIKVQVPMNITLRWELWRGFGKKDLIKSLAITGLAGVVALIFCFFSTWEAKGIVAMVSVLFVFVFCTGLFSRMDNNQSIYEFYRRKRDFMKNQQRFYYKKEKEIIEYAKKDN